MRREGLWQRLLTIGARIRPGGSENIRTSMAQHILVVDDDQEIRTLLAEYLERNGYRVSTLPDGRELARALEERAVDLLVLDLMMPGPDGLTLCRDLRAKGRLRGGHLSGGG